MADNTLLNTGTGGDTIASDDIAGVKYQRVKLIHGADGVNDGDVAIGDPLPVFPMYAPITLQTTVTRPANTTTYTVADALADTTPTAGGFTWTGAARASGGGGIITDVTVCSDAVPSLKLVGEIWIFNQSVTAVADNAAFVVSDAEIKTCIGIIPFACLNAGNNSFAHVAGLNIVYVCVGTANLRFLVRVRNAYIPVSGEALNFTMKGLQIN